MLAKKTNPLTIGLAFLPAIVLGSILYQSWSLAFVYGGDAFEAFFLTKLASRSVQFGVTFVLDVLIVWLLYKAKYSLARSSGRPFPARRSRRARTDFKERSFSL